MRKSRCELVALNIDCCAVDRYWWASISNAKWGREDGAIDPVLFQDLKC